MQLELVHFSTGWVRGGEDLCQIEAPMARVARVGTHQKVEPDLVDLSEFHEWREARAVPNLPKCDAMRKRGWSSFHVLVGDEIEVEF